MEAQNNKFKFDWVDGEGGPLILIEEKYLSNWEGSDSPSNNRVVEAKFRWNEQEIATDYDRACDVDDFIGVVDVGAGKALVLGDEPNAATWIELENKVDGILVRWVYGESEDEVINAAKSISTDTGKREDFVFSVEDSSLVLFAACESYSDSLYPRLKFKLHNGRYEVSTIEYKDERTSVICHRFRKL